MGNRMENQLSEDGPRMDPAAIRDLNWATLNWVAHYSFLPDSSSPPRTHAFVFPDSDRVCITRPEGESSERLAVEERENPGVRGIERPGREVSERSELEKDEHPESERQEIRRSLREGVSAHPGSGKRGLQEVRRTLWERERARPERVTCHSRRSTEAHPDAAAMARREGGTKITEKRILPEIPMHAGDFEELIKDLKTIGCSGLGFRV
jgi:hypothetical protein